MHLAIDHSQSRIQTDLEPIPNVAEQHVASPKKVLTLSASADNEPPVQEKRRLRSLPHSPNQSKASVRADAPNNSEPMWLEPSPSLKL
jgi:hypothetical protein